jgi:predicted amidohydrolase YtcJ
VDPAQSILFHNGEILTMEPGRPPAEALLIAGEEITAVGAEAEVLARAGPDTVRIDLDGRTLMPGFVDAHTHILNDARSRGLSLDEAQTLALSNGITTLGDLYVDQAFLREIQAFHRAGALRVRTSLYLVANDPCGRRLGPWWREHPPTRQPGEMLRIGGVKVFTDGGACGHPALSFEYNDEHGGDLWFEQAELDQLVAEIQAAGHQAAIHAIGDRAVAQAQAAVAQALDGGPNVFRHRLEHVSVLTPELVARFGELGLVPALPGNYLSCVPFGPPLPEAYGAWEWPWRELRAANPDLPIAWHSDYPYHSTSPFVHLYGFVTRRDVDRGHTCPPVEWLKDDTLAVDQALSIMTLQSAYALFRETEAGSLAVGKYADLVILSGNPLATEPEQLRQLRVLATLVGGRVEFCDRLSPDLCPGFQARVPAPLPDDRPPAALRWLVLALAVGLPGAASLGTRRAADRARLARLGGLAAMAGGLLWARAWLSGANGTSTASVWLMFTASSLLAAAGLSLARLERPSRLAGLGWTLAALGLAGLSVGLVLTEWFRWDPGWLLLVLGLLAHASGLVLVGLSHWLAGRRTVLGVWPAVIGALGGWLPWAWSLAANGSQTPTFLVALGLGLGWLVLGLLALRSAPARHPAAGRPVASPIDSAPHPAP